MRRGFDQIPFGTTGLSTGDCSSPHLHRETLHFWLILPPVGSRHIRSRARRISKKRAAPVCCDKYRTQRPTDRINSTVIAFPRSYCGLTNGNGDDTSWLRPTRHIWTRSKQPWVTLPEGDEVFE